MNVVEDRLWKRLMTLHQFGTSPAGGVTRFALTPEERAAKDCVAAWMREAGLEVRQDAVGNLIGRREGSDKSAPVVLVGSHVDSVPSGGDYDGPLGVLAAVEAAQILHDSGTVTKHPIEVVAFTDEEGARFRFGMTGSRGIAGTLTQRELENADANGFTIREAMRVYGLDPDRISDAKREQSSVKAYLELHIEQGKILENAGQPVGVVTGIAGPLWLRFTLQGDAGHAGTTPMNGRRDALVAASEIIQFIEQETSKEARTVGTVGQLSLTPGGVNIIPGKVEFTLDLRDTDLEVRNRVETSIAEFARHVCERRGIQLSIDELQRVDPALCDEDIQQAFVEAAKEVGLDAPALVSGAGHDGMQFTGLWPIGMLFARSKNGLSHHPDEFTSAEDCATAARVLYGALLRVAVAE